MVNNGRRLVRLTCADDLNLLAKSNKEMNATWEEARNIIYDLGSTTNENGGEKCMIFSADRAMWNGTMPQGRGGGKNGQYLGARCGNEQSATTRIAAAKNIFKYARKFLTRAQAPQWIIRTPHMAHSDRADRNVGNIGTGRHRHDSHQTTTTIASDWKAKQFESTEAWWGVGGDRSQTCPTSANLRRLAALPRFLRAGPPELRELHGPRREARDIWAEHMMQDWKPNHDETALMLRARPVRKTHSVVSAEENLVAFIIAKGRSNHLSVPSLQAVAQDAIWWKVRAPRMQRRW